MKRYWFQFDIESSINYPAGIGFGCGVTALDYSDAVTIMKKHLFGDRDLPPIKEVVENVDLRTLDQGHVTPNMKSPDHR